MKRNDTGEFCVIYIEPTDERSVIFDTIIGQKKPVVILLANQARIFQRPEDFAALKHLKRQIDIPIVFVISHSERLTQLAGRHGFPVYISMDALSESLAVGHLTRQRGRSATSSGPTTHNSAPRKTVPLTPTMTQNIPSPRKTQVLAESLSPQPSVPPSIKQQSHRRRFPAVLIVLTILALSAAGLGSFLLLFHKAPDMPATSVAVGHLYFLSSEQLSENSSQGIDDQVQLDLSNLSNPAPQKNYYAWLLGDKNQLDMKPTLLGMLQANKGNAHLFYAGDAHHTNLLEIASRFLVTEEDASVTPIAPSPEDSTWRYYGEIAQTPSTSADTMSGMGGTTHFSYLDHLRHLLATDPLLNEMELPGGLNNWMYRNTGKILEWTGSMREHWEETPDVSFIRRQTIRTLAYIDGLSYVQQDVPSTIPLGINDRLARIGLLQVNGSNQDPPSYLSQIVFHLNGLLDMDTSDTALRKNAAEIITAMSDIRSCLAKVRQDGQQLMKMSENQMHQPATLALLNDMIENANNAYVGQTDTTTGQVHQGVTWVHNQMQSLAVLNIMTYSPGSSSVQMIQDMKHMKGVRHIQGTQV